VNIPHVTSKRRISGHSQFYYHTISAKAIGDTRQGGNIMWQLVAAKMPLLLTKHTSTPTDTRRANLSLRADAHWHLLFYPKYTLREINKKYLQLEATFYIINNSLPFCHSVTFGNIHCYRPCVDLSCFTKQASKVHTVTEIQGSY
jgi:hypothetical protein